jgi:uncharacterized protein (TIGR02266 family)
VVSVEQSGLITPHHFLGGEMGNVDGEDRELKFFCPYCASEITPETERCPQCGCVYGPETLDVLTSPAQKKAESHPDDRRKHVRAHKTFKIAYSSSGSFAENYLSDIGTGGLFIKTNSPKDVGEQFNLKISLPNEEREVEVVCEVIWVNQKERVTPERTYPPGMGLKFLEPSQEAIETIIKTLSQELASC